MKPMIHAAIAALVLAGPAFSFAGSNTPVSEPAASSPGKPFAVFVDQPTGFTFVKMPSGWKFVGAITKEQAKHLPGSVLTSVLPADASRTENTASLK